MKIISFKSLTNSPRELGWKGSGGGEERDVRNSPIPSCAIDVYDYAETTRACAAIA